MKTPQIRSHLASVLACASLTGAFAAPTYTLTDLGTGGATDINSSGKVVGNDGASPWYFDGTNRTKLPVIPTLIQQPIPGEFPIDVTPSAAWAINDNGRIIGEGFSPGPPPQPGQPPINFTGFIWDGSGTGIMVGDYGVHGPYGVNSAGTVVGNNFLYTGTSAISLSGGYNVKGWAINDSGLAVGELVVQGTGWSSAATFDGTGASTVLNLGAGYFGARTGSAALGVNASGQVVGYVIDASSAPFPKVSLPFLYANGSAIVLGGFGGLTSQAKDINTAGVIVGSSMVPDNTPHAFVFTAGALTDLNGQVSSGGSGWVLNSANAVNDSGVIVGQGTKDGVAHAFLLTPAADNLPPAINLSPTGTNLFASESFTLGVAAAGSGPLTYQWLHAGTNIPNATNATYTVAHATANDAGSYLVKVSNAFGTTPSDSVTVVVKVLPDLSVARYAGITVTGPVGQTFRIEAVDHVNDTNWQALADVTLTTSTLLWFDADSLQHPGRFYRALPLPGTVRLHFRAEFAQMSAMKPPPIRRFVASVVACASLGGVLAGTYTLTDLGTGSAVDINRSGWVVGTDGHYVNGGPTNQGGWFYDGTNRTTLSFAALDIWNPRGYAFLVFTEPAAISDAGRIVGTG
ncbi:MAG TPA: DUF3466 family protein, partial [Candidatus Limnocylindria bacterium]|nr:DUF3466 family protein [Candidatus Limnocylindria bacterium]